jgi:hypothetical protein
LTEPEVRALAERGFVEEVTQFPGAARLRYRIEARKTVEGVHAGFVKSCLWVRVARDAVARWASSDEVGIEGEQPLIDGSMLRVTIEKDFACLNPTHAEDQTGTYPNPAAKRGNSHNCDGKPKERA